MILQLHPKQRCHLLIDIDTQNDFLLPTGSACVRNQAEVMAKIRQIMAWTSRENVPVISTVEVYPNNNGCSRFNYCLDGTEGQKKLPCTLLSRRVSFPADNKNVLPADVLLMYEQVILHKRCIDPFEEPRIERLFSEVQADEFVLIGAGTEDAVRATAIGLLQRGKKVSVIVDALGYHDKREAKLALRRMKAKGAQLMKMRDIAFINNSRLQEQLPL